MRTCSVSRRLPGSLQCMQIHAHQGQKGVHQRHQHRGRQQRTLHGLPTAPAASTAAAASAAPGQISSAAPYMPRTLAVVLGQDPNATPELRILFNSIATACKIIASKIARAGIEHLYGAADGDGVQQGGGERDAQKKLDVVANEVFKEVLAASGVVGVMASEEDDGPIPVVHSGGTARQAQQQHADTSLGAGAAGGLVVVFDPLDGSRNIEVSIPTGTIFGIYARGTSGTSASDLSQDCLQPGSRLLAAGYGLYSSATMLVVSVGSGVHGFTLDPSIGEFVLSHPDIKVPERGQIYSLNDARFHDWPAGLQQYIDAIRQGRSQSGKQYSSRYVCSLVADFHRTLLYGGWAANPREHLRLVYEANPLAFLAEQAGGKGSDGRRRILDIVPSKLHQRLPLFLGSKLDIEELESYGDVQQLSGKKYDV